MSKGHIKVFFSSLICDEKVLYFIIIPSTGLQTENRSGKTGLLEAARFIQGKYDFKGNPRILKIISSKISSSNGGFGLFILLVISK